MAINIVRFCAERLGVSQGVVRRIADQAPHRYKRYKIKKKKPGEYRWVAQPAREVKALQRAIVTFLSEGISPDQSATAYAPGSSIAKNAAIHAGAKHLLKLDFCDFFGSIKQADVVSLLRMVTKDEASDVELRLISRALCWAPSVNNNLSLCIGAPSSPFVSNAIMMSFDRDLREAANEFNVRYTRYSDDMTFSGMDRDSLIRLERFVAQTCSAMITPKLRLNESKRILVSRSSSMSVTGLCLSTQGGVTVGRKRKRGIRSGINVFLRGGLSAKEVEKLHGEIAFACDVEKNFLNQLYGWYGVDVDRILKPYKAG